MLHYAKLKKVSGDKHSSLLGAFVSYKENEVWGIRPLVPILQYY
jgi:hypothetical protein